MDKFLTSMNRRTFLKGTAAGIGILAAPAIISSRALASSGEVNFMGWAGYPDLAAKVFPAFEKATGIKVNFNEQPDQDAMFAQAKLSLQTGAIDVVEPTVDRIGGWASQRPDPGLGHSASWRWTTICPASPTARRASMATVDGKRMIVPSVWGTEAIVYSKTDAPTEYGKASLGDLFDPKFEGKVCVRAALGARRHGPLPRLRGQAAEALARRLQGRSHDEGSSGTSRSPRRSSTRPMSCSSGTARTTRRPPTAPTARSSA